MKTQGTKCSTQRITEECKEHRTVRRGKEKCIFRYLLGEKERKKN